MLLLKLGGGPSPHDGDDDSPGDVDLVVIKLVKMGASPASFVPLAFNPPGDVASHRIVVTGISLLPSDDSPYSRVYVDAEDEYASLWTRFLNHASRHRMTTFAPRA
jgi:hypothetical protein